MTRAVAALVAAAICGTGVSACGSDSRQSAPRRAPTGLERDVGQMLLVGVSAGGTTPAVRALVERGEAGGVVVYGQVLDDRVVRRTIATLRTLARRGGNAPLLVAVDQEGGEVKRIAAAPPSLDPEQIGRAASPFAVARRQGAATGRALRALGFDLDLAPVADVPRVRTSVPSRYFGTRPATVAAGAAGFALGLNDAGIAAAAKHFPGLGSAPALQTDAVSERIDASAGVLRAGLAPYRRLASLGPAVAPVVMMSSASYPALDPTGTPAVLSRRIAGDELRRAGLGDRVVMTDDLTTPGVSPHGGAPTVAAAAAGDDLLLYAADPAQVVNARSELLAAVASGRLPRARIVDAAARVARLKARLGAGG